MTPGKYIASRRLRKSEELRLTDFLKMAMESHGIAAEIYSSSDADYLLMAIPQDFNEEPKGGHQCFYGIDMGKWIDTVVAFESDFIGLKMLVRLDRNGAVNAVRRKSGGYMR